MGVTPRSWKRLGVAGKMSESESSNFQKKKKKLLTIELRGTRKGLGIRIVGGRNIRSGENSFGIFLKEIIPGQLAEKNGRIKVGDQLLSANNMSLIGVSNERAVEILKQCAATDVINLQIERDEKSYLDFLRVSKDFSTDTQAKPPETDNGSDLASVSDISGSTLGSGDILDEKEEKRGKFGLSDMQHSVGINNQDEISSQLNRVPSLSESDIPFASSKIAATEQNEKHFQGVPTISSEDRKTQAKSQLYSAGSQGDAPDVYFEEKKMGSSTPLTARLTQKDISRLAGRHTRKELRYSVDPSHRFKLQTLFWAVNFTGYKLSQEQQHSLTKELTLDSDGKVAFSEFLAKLKSYTSLDSDKLLAAISGNGTSLENSSTKELHNLKDTIRRQREEILHLQQALRTLENDTVRKQREEILLLQQALRTLENKCDVSRQEIEAVKQSQHQISDKELLKKLATKDCELKKMEAANRRYQVATETLQKFVEDCHEALRNSKGSNIVLDYPQGKGASVIRGDQVTGNPRPPSYLSNHSKKTSQSLAKSASDALAEVRRILSVETLPYGWEEQYTEDGRKYYVNHHYQTTSWVHPVTRQPGVKALSLDTSR